MAPSENQPESHSSAILFADMQFFAKVEARIIVASYQLGHDPTRILILITVSANDPYLQPGGWISKDAAQQDQDRPSACERRRNGCCQTVLLDDPKPPSEIFLTATSSEATFESVLTTFNL